MTRITLKAISLLMISYILIQPAMAGDEDMMSPYTQFDPETGFFIPIDPQAVEQQPQVQDNSTMALNTTQGTDQQIQEEPAIPPSSSQNLVLFISGGIFLLVTGFTLLHRRNQNKIGQ